MNDLVSYVSYGWKQAEVFDVSAARHDG